MANYYPAPWREYHVHVEVIFLLLSLYLDNNISPFDKKTSSHLDHQHLAMHQHLARGQKKSSTPLTKERMADRVVYKARLQ
eukprot:scaffold17824_cov94-Skeletonema_dohrnii-CCMP3373.AAC.1